MEQLKNIDTTETYQTTMLGRVEELIDLHSGQWDEELVRSIFSPVYVHRILQIPLQIEVMYDFIAWYHTRSSTFFVRFVYHVEFEHKFGHNWNRNDRTGSHQERKG